MGAPGACFCGVGLAWSSAVHLRARAAQDPAHRSGLKGWRGWRASLGGLGCLSCGSSRVETAAIQEVSVGGRARVGLGHRKGSSRPWGPGSRRVLPRTLYPQPCRVSPAGVASGRELVGGGESSAPCTQLISGPLCKSAQFFLRAQNGEYTRESHAAQSVPCAGGGPPPRTGSSFFPRDLFARDRCEFRTQALWPIAAGAAQLHEAASRSRV